MRPGAILISHSVEGRDVVGGVAARSRSALLVDATGIHRDAEGAVALAFDALPPPPRDDRHDT